MGLGRRRSACRTTGFSSIQTTVSVSESGFSYRANTSSMRPRYSASSSATHHIFFPPRLQVMTLEQDANRFPAHPPCQLPLHCFLGDEPDTPPRPPFRRRAAHEGDDPLTLARVQHPALAGTWLLVQRRFQPLLRVAPGNRPHGFGRHAHLVGNLRRSLSLVQLAQDRSSRSTRADSRPLFSIPVICFRSF